MPLKSWKPNLSVIVFKEENELLMNLGPILGEPFNKFQKFIQESSGFSFSKLFADDLS